MFKLGTKVTEKATGMKGMLVNLQIQSDGARFYNFQPRLLNPETGEPAKRFWVTADRVEGGVEVPEDDLPMGVLNSQAQDEASGFKGTVLAITLHVSGCVHLEIQPTGYLRKTGTKIDANSFDIRQCSGPAIGAMTEAEKEADKKQKPSPLEITRPGPGEL